MGKKNEAFSNCFIELCGLVYTELPKLGDIDADLAIRAEEMGLTISQNQIAKWRQGIFFLGDRNRGDGENQREAEEQMENLGILFMKQFRYRDNLDEDAKKIVAEKIVEQLIKLLRAGGHREPKRATTETLKKNRSHIFNQTASHNNKVSNSKYIRRPEDDLAEKIVGQSNYTLHIKSPKYTGKTSLLRNLCLLEEQRGKKVVLIDMGEWVEADDPKAFFFKFACAIVYKLGVPEGDVKSTVESLWSDWKTNQANVRKCIRHLMSQNRVGQHTQLVLALDNVDVIFNYSFKETFFEMIRAWHNRRANDAVMKRVSFILVTATEPSLSLDSHVSPFNVAKRITLSDFKIDQVKELYKMLDYPSTNPETDPLKLYYLLQGHPYLTRLALEYLAQGYSFESLKAIAFDRSSERNSPFYPHLREKILKFFATNPDYRQDFQQIIEDFKCREETMLIFEKMGLIKLEKGEVLPRNNLYVHFFESCFNGN